MTTNIHDYSQAEAIILSVDSVSTVVAGLPLIDPTPAPNTVPMSLDTGNIDPAWFDTPDFNLSEIAGSSGGVDMTPIPKSTVKVQAPSGSDIVALGLLADREDILVIATQDSICLDVKPLAKPTSDQLLRSRQIRLALLPRVTLHNLTSLDNSVTVPAHLSAKLPTTSGGSLSAGDLWLITLDWVEGRFKSQPAGWHMTEVFGPFVVNAGTVGPIDQMLLDGATAIFPVGPTAPVPVGRAVGRFGPANTPLPARLYDGNARFVSGGSSIWYGAHNDNAKTSGKWYWELVLHTTVNYNTATTGLCTAFDTNGAGLSTAIALMFTCGPGTTQRIFSDVRPIDYTVQYQINVGDAIGFAYDLDALTVKIYVNGVLWQTVNNAPSGMRPYIGAQYNISGSGHFFADELLYPAPAGYTPWSQWMLSMNQASGEGPDIVETVPVDQYFPSGSRIAVLDVATTNPERAYITPFLWGLSYYSN